MKKLTFVIVLIVLVLGAVGMQAEENGAEVGGEGVLAVADMVSGKDGQWTTLFGNKEQNGHSALLGEMGEAPEVVAEYDLRAYHSYALIAGGNGDEEKGVDIRGLTAKQLEEKYDINGAHHGVGDGFVVERINQNVKYANLYEGELNYIYIDETPSQQNDRKSAIVVCRVLDATGQMEELWRSDLPYYHERPHIILADMNGDGVTDLLVLGWEGIVVFDGVSHQVIMHLPQSAGWHSARKRGIFAAEDIDGDGLPELMVFSFYPWDVNVIENDGEKLSVNWYHVYDNDIASAWQVGRYIREPIGDFDNDGNMELAYSVWNAAGDMQWHIEVRDALTGELKYDIEKRFLHDAVRQQNGEYLLFAAESQGSSVPVYTNLEVLNIREGAVNKAYEAQGAYMYAIDDISRDNYAVHSGMFKRSGVLSVVIDKSQEEIGFFIKSKIQNGYEMTRHTLNGKDNQFLIQWDENTDINLWKQIEGGGIIASVTSLDSAPEFTVQGASISLQGMTKANNGKTYLPVAGLFDGQMRVLIADQMNGALMLSLKDNSLALIERSEGLGMAYEYNTSMDYGFVIGDVNGDGENEWLARVSTEQGAAVRCMKGNGETLWETVFPMFHCENDMELLGKLSFFAIGDAGDKKIVIVNGQRNVQHTGITYGLDGATGEILWNIDIIRPGASHASGAGAYYISLADLTGDGIDEVMNGYGNNIWAANAQNGEILFNAFMRGLFEPYWIKDNPNGWVSNIRAIFLKRDALDAYLFLADADSSTGVMKVIYGDEPEQKQEAFRRLSESGRSLDINNIEGILLESRPGMLWGNEVWDAMNNRQQCLADLQGDGNQYIIETCALIGDYGSDQIVRAVDADTGETIYSYKLGNPGEAYLIACDIDGDGQDEVLAAYSSKLYALKIIEGKLKPLWEKRMGQSMGWPIFCDLDGDGLGEIAIYTKDGLLKILK